MDLKKQKPNSRNTKTAPFLKMLPLELRTEVYRNLLSTQYTKTFSVSEKLPLIHARLWPRYAYHFFPTILRTCRQIHNEASSVLYDENLFVRVQSNSSKLRVLLDIQGIPILLEGRKAKTFKHCAMSVDFDRLATVIKAKSQNDGQCYVIASSDVQLLCQSLFILQKTDGNVLQNHKIRVIVHRMFDDMLSKTPAPTSPQRRLLEPFTVLHSFPNFEIAGTANTEYCAGIAAHVSRMAPTFDEHFHKMIELKDKGDGNVSRNNCEGAVRFYKMALSQLICFCIRGNYMMVDWRELHGGRQSAVADMTTTLLANLAFSHYRLDEFEDAHFWAYIATKGDPSRVAVQRETSYAKIVYLKAMASVRMGKRPQAVEELCKGLSPVTKAAYKDKELLAMRCEMRCKIKGLGGIKLLHAMGIGHVASASPVV